MARKKTLNERRLTKRQVEALIASGARARPDLTAALEDALLPSRVYELDGDRYLLVFGEFPGLEGKGDIYAADDFHRFVRWSVKVNEDARHGRQSSSSSLGLPFAAQGSTDLQCRPPDRAAPFDDVADAG